jgi:P-type Ca2+ transporter type 2C
MVAYIILFAVFLMALLLLAPPLMRLFEFDRLTLLQLAIAVGTGAISVLWFEPVKWYRTQASKFRSPAP